MALPVRRIVWTTAGALVGFLFGWSCTTAHHIMPRQADYPELAEYAALPHHISKYPGGVSLRFAMVHDVLLERFPRHGKAHYEERNRRTRERIASLPRNDPARFPLADDLAAGLERLGRPADAVEVMREKLILQKAKGISGREMYTTYANLGTFMAHASFPKALAGNADAKQEFREGISFVRKSVEVNPQAHFGREQWQVVLGEFMLAAKGKPQLLKEFDFLGNRLDLPIDGILNRDFNWTSTGYGRPYNRDFGMGLPFTDPGYIRLNESLEDPTRWGQVKDYRSYVTKVGAEEGWKDVSVPSHREPTPFDEPVLGIIGMWRQGGGASPHFCLALGETMLRVGQRFIAWEAFERASRLAKRYWPDPDCHLDYENFLMEHCRKRQQEIEKTMTSKPEWARNSADWQASPGEVTSLRANFDKELAYGEGYQREYQQYEAAKIAAGTPIDEEHFFDDFLADRPPIASPVGGEDWFKNVPRSKIREYTSGRATAWGVFGAGLGAILVALVLRWRSRPKRRAPVSAAPVRRDDPVQKQ